MGQVSVKSDTLSHWRAQKAKWHYCWCVGSGRKWRTDLQHRRERYVVRYYHLTLHCGFYSHFYQIREWDIIIEPLLVSVLSHQVRALEITTSHHMMFPWLNYLWRIVDNTACLIRFPSMECQSVGGWVWCGISLDSAIPVWKWMQWTCKH